MQEQRLDSSSIAEDIAAFVRAEVLTKGEGIPTHHSAEVLGLESIQFLRVLLYIERRYDVHLTDALMQTYRALTFDALAALVARQLEEKA